MDDKPAMLGLEGDAEGVHVWIKDFGITMSDRTDDAWSDMTKSLTTAAGFSVADVQRNLDHLRAAIKRSDTP